MSIDAAWGEQNAAAANELAASPHERAMKIEGRLPRLSASEEKV